MLNSKGEPLWLFEGMPKAGNLSGLPPYTMDDARRELFKLIDATPCLDWLLLTKRPENVLRMWPDCPPCDSSIVCKRGDGIVCPDDTCDREHGIARFRPNVWIGTSVSDQATADQNVPLLLKCRELAPVLFLSCEPLLGTVQFPLPCRDSVLWGGISWVIVGGESGPNRRSVDLAAITGIVDQCCAASCPVFVKQDTALRPGQQGRIPDKYWAFKQFPEVACAR